MLIPDLPHLPLPFRERGNARLEGGGSPNPRVEQNKTDRIAHAGDLANKLGGVGRRRTEQDERRLNEGLPSIQGGVPFLLQIPDEDDDAIDFIAEKLGIEVVAEFDDGYLVVATGDLDLQTVIDLANQFAQSIHGSGKMAKILDVEEDPLSERRVKRILGDELFAAWPFENNTILVLDVSIESAIFGAPPKPRLRKNMAEDKRLERIAEYDAKKAEHYGKWDATRIERETEIEDFVGHYGGEILHIVDDSNVVDFPDSFSARIRMSGEGFKDLVANYPSLFEIAIPDDIELPRNPDQVGLSGVGFELLPPREDAPFVCVIDSGIQEEHPWLRAAIASEHSRCFIPGEDESDVADYVGAGGHGTRVAGAILHPESVPREGNARAQYWIQNARALDSNCSLISRIYPPELLHEVVDHFNGEHGTRVFNHSIASNVCCRLSRMSAWAAAIDYLAFDRDVLFIQAAGNLHDITGQPNRPGILEHIAAGRQYPGYLYEASSRIANPAQSLQAITVGSISRQVYEDADRRSISDEQHPSSFSRTGFGLWQAVKPEVVEFGGDDVIDSGNPPSTTNPPEVCPELLRSNMHGGPLFSADAVGTSFSTPKVAGIAGHLEAIFPTYTTQLYRALIVNSARWPEWAEQAPVADRPQIVRSIGYGVPDLARASQNSTDRVTLISSDEFEIAAKEGLIFGVPIPEELRNPGDDLEVRIDVTLSYVAEPRRTRRGRRGYLGVWLDWKSSKRGEDFESFRSRALKDSDDASEQGGSNVRWTLGNKSERDGLTDGVSRRNGTVQKDWTYLRSYDLPDTFGIVVRGHEGWDRRNPEARARFCLAITFQVIGTELPVYELIRQAVEVELSAEVEAEV